MTTLIESLAGVPVGSRLGQAPKTRAEILRLSEAAHDAVLSDRHRQHLQKLPRCPKYPRGRRRRLQRMIATASKRSLQRKKISSTR
jgi:hypothetical protein